MAEQLRRVDTLFLHGRDDDYEVAAIRDGERVLRGVLELKKTDAGPRPGRFRVSQGDDEEPRDPGEFVDIARRARRIRISEQTAPAARAAVEEALAGYQLEATAVRTCRYCAAKGRYSPLTDETAVQTGETQVCRDCAVRELERELAYRGSITGGARDRLEELLFEVGDLDRIVDLLGGELDPELTKVDEMPATTDDLDPVAVADLDVHPAVASVLTERFETLLPVQSRAVERGLLGGEDLLVVSATATGKTLVGEIAGIDRLLSGEGKLLFLVPLVALANQTYGDFQEEYGHLAEVTLRVGASRIGGGSDPFDPDADIVVGTYEGVDHALRVGRDLGDIGTVVIDEIHSLKEPERGHRLDGLISRLTEYTDGDTQSLYLSATVGNPEWLAHELGARLVEFEERPVPIERHVTFADGPEKPDVVDRLVRREFDRESSKGYRGQTIVFTNARRRCHELARALEYPAAAYHAGLDNDRRKRVERRFADQELAAVVTTAALAAGVDFPASQVVFDSLAMGIEWLSVQEFHQMLGRAGRPDYHDRGAVYLLVEPDCRYHSSMERTEDEVAFALLKDEMESVEPRYDEAAAIEETLANVAVAGAGAKRLNERMVGDIDTTRAVAKLLEYGFIDGLAVTPLGRAVARHFLSPDEASLLLEGIRAGAAPDEMVADFELREKP